MNESFVLWKTLYRIRVFILAPFAKHHTYDGKKVYTPKFTDK